MTTLARDEVVGTANALLVAVCRTVVPTQVVPAERGGAFLYDPIMLRYQIYDVSSDAKRLAPVQVFPTTPGNWQPVDLVNDKLSKGRFAARWTVPHTETLGWHLIKWQVQFTPTSAVWTWTEDFEVIAAKAQGFYPISFVTLTECREAGITEAQASDVRLQLLIAEATRYIMKVTGRCFVPQYKMLRYDGRGTRNLLIDEPIVAIQEVILQYLDVDMWGVENADYAVYNRHLTEGLLIPDDRESPKLVLEWVNPRTHDYPTLVRRLAWPIGEQNVVLWGVFGYTDPDGSPCGFLPLAIRRVAILLIKRLFLPKTTEMDSWSHAAGPISSESTQGQSVGFQALSRGYISTVYTGDPEIDQILVAYRRPSSMGAV